MSHNNSPDNESVYNSPPEDLFPVFPYDNLPQDLFTVFLYDNPPQNTPPEVLFPPLNNPPQNNPPANNPPQNQPNTFGLTDAEFFEQDLQVLLAVQAEEERQARAREARAKARQDRLNRRAEWRWAMGLNRVPSSEADSSNVDSSDEGYDTNWIIFLIRNFMFNYRS